MKDPTRNPFSELGLDPRATPEALTEELRELAEAAPPEERRHLQGAWRRLTLKPEDRLRAALFAHAAPKRGVAPEVDAAALGRKHRLPAPDVSAVAAFVSAPPAPAGLVLLPAPSLQPAGPEAAWPDLAPEDDPLLKL